MEVGHVGCRVGLQQTEVHVLRELMEEAATAAQQDGHLVEDELVTVLIEPSTETAWALKTLLMSLLSLLRC
jgi:hypothetical protein